MAYHWFWARLNETTLIEIWSVAPKAVKCSFSGSYCSLPGTRSTGITIPLDHTSWTERGILSFWAIQCLHRYAEACTPEGPLQLRFGVRPTLRIAGRQRPFPTVGEVIQLHWAATTRFKLSSLQPIRCCSAISHLPHWLRGTQDISDKWRVTAAPNNRKRGIKKSALRFGYWNVRAMLTGLSNDLQITSDVRNQQ